MYSLSLTVFFVAVAHELSLIMMLLQPVCSHCSKLIDVISLVTTKSLEPVCDVIEIIISNIPIRILQECLKYLAHN